MSSPKFLISELFEDFQYFRRSTGPLKHFPFPTSDLRFPRNDIHNLPYTDFRRNKILNSPKNGDDSFSTYHSPRICPESGISNFNRNLGTHSPAINRSRSYLTDFDDHGYEHYCEHREKPRELAYDYRNRYDVCQLDDHFGDLEFGVPIYGGNRGRTPLTGSRREDHDFRGYCRSMSSQPIKSQRGENWSARDSPGAENRPNYETTISSYKQTAPRFGETKISPTHPTYSSNCYPNRSSDQNLGRSRNSGHSNHSGDLSLPITRRFTCRDSHDGLAGRFCPSCGKFGRISNGWGSTCPTGERLRNAAELQCDDWRRERMANYSYCTIIDNPEFKADVFAEKIDRALRGGEKEAIVNTLTSISNAQRQQLRGPYKLKYGKEIDEALDKKFSGDSEMAILALMETPLEYDVKQLKKAMKGGLAGLGTDETVLIEILCSRTADQLRAIRTAYEKNYGKQLEKDVAGDTSGEFRDLLVALVTGAKDPSHETNDTQAKDDAVRLFADGKGKLAGDKNAPSHFLKILATQNQYQLRKVFAEFEKLSGVSIEKAIEKEFSGDLRTSYLTIARASTNKQKFFAIQLYNAMKGLGTRDNDLIRVLVTRSEVDLRVIKDEYKELYGKTLEDHIKGDTSGLYKDCLLKIVAGNY